MLVLSLTCPTNVLTEQVSQQQQLLRFSTKLLKLRKSQGPLSNFAGHVDALPMRRQPKALDVLTYLPALISLAQTRSAIESCPSCSMRNLAEQLSRNHVESPTSCRRKASRRTDGLLMHENPRGGPKKKRRLVPSRPVSTNNAHNRRIDRGTPYVMQWYGLRKPGTEAECAAEPSTIEQAIGALANADDRPAPGKHAAHGPVQRLGRTRCVRAADPSLRAAPPASTIEQAIDALANADDRPAPGKQAWNRVAVAARLTGG